jgi:3-oxoacyl-[acyl-carrier protein] reductase
VARRGARVAVHYRRSRAGAEETAGAIGAAAKVFGADLTQAAEVARVVEEVQRQLGPIDILVNNAGDLVDRRTLLEMTEALWREVQDANVTTTFLCTQAVARSMVDRRRGVIVNMSSLAAHNGGGPGALAYASAKAAVIAFTKAVAKELAPHGIRVNCVSPGLIDNTQFHGRFTPREAFDAAARTIPLGRAGQPEDVAQVIAFLCSDDSGFLAGETIEVNGGMFMR